MADRQGIDNPISQTHNGAKGSNVTGETKSESGSKVHEEETHGKSDDIDQNTRVDEVKGPSVVQRVKEEVEAVVGAVVHPKK